ncbi:MAG TPA: HlyD family efflux transporter periplasmic adaptor subunit [Candidatus Paceibacterota bacterium]|nr:HlyD family efflux transporter periplasmic adaptor subunit [Candidatus Paceibacterota bacterium]
MAFIQKVWAVVRNLPLVIKLAGIAVLLVVIVVAVHFSMPAPAAQSTAVQISHVQIASVASLSSQTGPLPVIGKVTSESHATILAQTSGEITSLAVSIGQYVDAGQIIAEFQNASQEAAVEQAQGAYNAALASLSNAEGATAANSSLTSSQATVAAATAGTTAIASMQSMYAALDDSVHTKTDTLFTNPRSTTVLPTFNLTIPDNQLQVDLVNERIALEATLSNANEEANTASSSASIDVRIDALTSDAQTVLNFLTNVVKATNEAEATTNITTSAIAADQTAAGAARTEVVTALSGLASAKNAYDAAQTSSQTAANTAGSGTQNAIAQAQAQVQQELGALDAAKAALANTVARSPISGTIVSLPVTEGDYVSAYSQIAQVSNPSALEIDTYVTPDDAKTLEIGGKATIEGGAAGVITSIAPAIDPSTNEILVKIGITSGLSSLTDGDSVTVSLARANATTATNSASEHSIVIPLNAARITPQGPVVFTVSSSTLVSVPITLGTILGDQVTVVSGLTLEMDIVTDARGLSDGEQVIVDTP